MGIFRQFPYTNFHELNLDKILEMVKDSNEKISKVYDTIYNNLKDIIYQWFEEHPDLIDYALIEDSCKTLINDSLGGISYEIGKTEKDIYTIITIPKDKFKMTLEPVCEQPTDSAPIRKFVLEKNPNFAMNISNTGDFIYNGILYGSDYTQGLHGSIYALRNDESVDFDIFENPTMLSEVRDAGYKYAIASWNALRVGGVNRNVDYEYSTYKNVNPRQTLAWDDEKWYIYTSYSRLAIYGYETENLYGLTMREVRDFCENRGYPNVIALDGGGSIYNATGKPFVELSPNINNGYWRSAYMCIAFNERSENDE